MRPLLIVRRLAAMAAPLNRKLNGDPETEQLVSQERAQSCMVRDQAVDQESSCVTPVALPLREWGLNTPCRSREGEVSAFYEKTLAHCLASPIANATFGVNPAGEVRGVCIWDPYSGSTGIGL